MIRHKIDFRYAGTEDDAAINLAFNKKKVEERKEWLSNWMEEKKQRSEMGLPAVSNQIDQEENLTMPVGLERFIVDNS